ncbi:uncharacterized protein LOC130495930 [Raphanus sativus]|uniref:Uncharacterized protein LOC130495930 n=1 Tax=Raphanus sativus TaxID=3726 RepID=A0A9W3BW89_RAPSA|nr:uncharacterized protein LOC130495930 [Raphanus sativus]
MPWRARRFACCTRRRLLQEKGVYIHISSLSLQRKEREVDKQGKRRDFFAEKRGFRKRWKARRSHKLQFLRHLLAGSMPMMTTPLSLQTSKTTLTSSSMPLWTNTRLASKTPSTRYSGGQRRLRPRKSTVALLFRQQIQLELVVLL